MNRFHRRDEVYVSLIQSWRWRKLRAEYLSSHPFCERCHDRERLTAATLVHHIKPVEDAYGVGEKTRLAFDPENLMALCQECHEAVHHELNKNSKEQQRQRAHERTFGFLAAYFGDATPGG